MDGESPSIWTVNFRIRNYPDYLQGYFFPKPKLLDEIIKMLKSDK